MYIYMCVCVVQRPRGFEVSSALCEMSDQLTDPGQLLVSLRPSERVRVRAGATCTMIERRRRRRRRRIMYVFICVRVCVRLCVFVFACVNKERARASNRGGWGYSWMRWGLVRGGVLNKPSKMCVHESYTGKEMQCDI